MAIGIATAFYRKYSPIPDRLERSFSGLHRAASHRFYIDEVYLFVTKKIIFNCISRSIAWFDRHVIDGAMDGLAYVTNRMSVPCAVFSPVRFSSMPSCSCSERWSSPCWYWFFD